MSKLAFLFWLSNIVLDTTGHLAFKRAASSGEDRVESHWRHMVASPALWTGVGCFGLEFVVWFSLLSLVPLSLAVLIGSINIVVVMLAGRLLFDERLDRMRLAGMWLISIGVLLSGGFA
jgi:drug/metabolite transporter (DMT)-like permease